MGVLAICYAYVYRLGYIRFAHAPFLPTGWRTQKGTVSSPDLGWKIRPSNVIYLFIYLSEEQEIWQNLGATVLYHSHL